MTTRQRPGSEPVFTPSLPLSVARQRLTQRLNDGITCPCCNQFAKVYRFGLNAAMVRALAKMFQQGGTEWVRVPDLGLPGGHFAKLRFWGLIEKPDGQRREDGSTRVGTWRVTQQGVEFLAGRLNVARFALIYNNSCLGVIGEPLSVHEALGQTFDYRELMS